jgi:hypothetical protein
VSLLGLFDALGVRPGTGAPVELDEGARLAGVRRSIVAQDAMVISAVARLASSGPPGSGSVRAKAGVEKP